MSFWETLQDRARLDVALMTLNVDCLITAEILLNSFIKLGRRFWLAAMQEVIKTHRRSAHILYCTHTCSQSVCCALALSMRLEGVPRLTCIFKWWTQCWSDLSHVSLLWEVFQRVSVRLKLNLIRQLVWINKLCTHFYVFLSLLSI